MYLDLLKTVADDNKYWKWYTNLILSAKNRDLTGYTEKHHILPVSFGMGGETDKENLVILTAREHYLAHRLLSKLTGVPALKRKMYFAVTCMAQRCGVSRHSRQYEHLKKNFNAAMIDLWMTDEYRDKVMAAKRWYYTDEVSQKKNSDLQKELMLCPVRKEKCTRPMLDAHKSIDHSTTEWLGRSLHSDEARVKAKITHQSESHREACKVRELSKGTDALSNQGKLRHAKRVEKAGGAEAYSKQMSEKIKGRINLYNPLTLEHRCLHEIPDGWFRLKELSPQQRALFPKRNKTNRENK